MLRRCLLRRRVSLLRQPQLSRSWQAGRSLWCSATMQLNQKLSVASGRLAKPGCDLKEWIQQQQQLLFQRQRHAVLRQLLSPNHLAENSSRQAKPGYGLILCNSSRSKRRLGSGHCHSRRLQEPCRAAGHRRCHCSPALPPTRCGHGATAHISTAWRLCPTARIRVRQQQARRRSAARRVAT